MSFHPFTTLEKLIVVETLIDETRLTMEGVGDHHRLKVLRAIGADLRGRLEGVPNQALLELERRLLSAEKSKTRLGRERGAMIGVAEELIGRWPVVKQALERFGEE